MPAYLENSAPATGLEKINFHSNPKEKKCQRMYKLPYNHTHFTCQEDFAQNPSSQASVIHEPRTFRCISWIQKRQRSPRSDYQHTLDHRKRKGIPKKKKIYLCFIDYAKTFYYVDHNKQWNLLKEMGIPDHLTCLLRNLYTGQEATELDMEQWTGSKLGKEFVKSEDCYPAYLTYVQSTSCKMSGWMNHKLESRLLGEISTASYMQMIPL